MLSILYDEWMKVLVVQIKNEKVLYVLGCRAGLFLLLSRPILKKINVKILVNPDGAEWKRAKWNFIAKQIVRFYEVCLLVAADIVVCDAMSILEIINKEFKIEKNKLKFIAYGSDIYNKPALVPKDLEQKYTQWLSNQTSSNNPYYLMVGRFVPENNFELIIKEYMRSKTLANLLIVSNVSDNKFFRSLSSRTDMNSDSRIKLVGTVYDQDLLKLIRARATGYIHGHEVGGTNPSLLEALGSTNINLVYDVPFNREVVDDAGYYFNSSTNNLTELIRKVDSITNQSALSIGKKAKKRIKLNYNWQRIIADYERLFNE